MSTQNRFLDLNQFKLLFPIGSGGFSKVYRVKNVKTDEYFAAKISNILVDEDTSDSAETLSLFREINIISSLDHPSILKFIGYSQYDFEGNPRPTIVTEFANNGSLYNIIQLEIAGLSSDDWNMTKKIINIYGIAIGMSYLHANNIIHRDLKTENILMDDFLYPKIADFGLSKITDILSVSMNFQSQKGLKGTPIYLAPEIITEEKYSKASDVYAFAYIIFEIMTGEIPFKNLTFNQLLKKISIQGHRPEIADDVPIIYKELIEKCWSQNPDERPSFDHIVEELKNNQDFITDLIDESEFLDYVDYIDNIKSSFDISNQLIHFEDFIKVHGRNKMIKKVTLKNLDLDNENQSNQINENSNLSENSSDIKNTNENSNSQQNTENEESTKENNGSAKEESTKENNGSTKEEESTKEDESTKKVKDSTKEEESDLFIL